MIKNLKITIQPKLVIATIAACLTTFIILATIYRNVIHQNTLNDLQINIEFSARGQARALENELQKFSLLPLALSENPDVYDALQNPTSENIQRLNTKLASLAESTGAPYIYVINRKASTIASSNFDQSDSFVGRQYEFRPYFQRALAEGMASYFAKGERTGKAGLFLARRVDKDNQILGVIIVKVEFDEITDLWQSDNSTTFVTNPDDIILFSSDRTLTYSTLNPLPRTRRAVIEETRQFADEALELAPIKIGQNTLGQDSAGQYIKAAILDIPELNWRIFRIERVQPALNDADLRIQFQILCIGVFIVGIALFILWRFSREQQRVRATELLQTEVARQTRELSDTNKKLELEIKQRTQINERFRNAREELAQANRLGSIGAITTSVTHEINQPVAAIHAFAENATKLMARDERECVHNNLLSIIELTHKIGTITTGLRRYARRGAQSIVPLSIDQIVDGVELLIGERIHSANVDFKIVGNINSMPEILAGRVRLEQVLVNILQNALEAVQDIPDPKIEMRISEEQKYLSITISDNGIGVEEDIRSEIFTPFFTKKPNGLGIGLGIAKDLMKEFGGTLELMESQLGGAAFKLLLRKT